MSLDVANFVAFSIKEKPSIQPYYFEKYKISVEFQKWTYENTHLFHYIWIAYLVVIFSLQSYMKNRQAWNLKYTLAAWNFGLTIFSAVGWIRVTQQLIEILLLDNGFHKSVCVRGPVSSGMVVWAVLGVVSKIIEFGDTIFIVLRKRPLIFLHWYHHIATYIVTYYATAQAEPVLLYFGFINWFVHSIMYTYFGLASLGVRLPRKFAMALTCTQIAQFFVGFIVVSYGFSVKMRGEECALSDKSCKMMLGMFLSYIVLWIHFFYKNYGNGAAKKKIN